MQISLILHAKSIDLFNVIVFIRATEHVITMLCHMTKNCGWQKHFSGMRIFRGFPRILNAPEPFLRSTQIRGENRGVGGVEGGGEGRGGVGLKSLMYKSLVSARQ